MWLVGGRVGEPSVKDMVVLGGEPVFWGVRGCGCVVGPGPIFNPGLSMSGMCRIFAGCRLFVTRKYPIIEELILAPPKPVFVSGYKMDMMLMLTRC